ncbi:UV radiation resistance protein and autophagy-related subunit 14-domain-containing protein [Trametes punicea]|nr:UV radiation resistance protein and autophagy-related subunit 14-domain-containing protein [Trametes punicea]
MPLSTTSSWPDGLNDHAAPALPLPRRVRHITSIQIRNLTPFPARDALASALTKPSEQPQFTPYGHLSDDLDVTVGRKRGRRFSAASSTFSGLRGEDESAHGGTDHPGERTLRRRTSSRASIPLSTSAGSSSPKLARRPSTAGGSPPARSTHRSRTLSHASSRSQHAGSSSHLSGDMGTSASTIFPDLFRDTSQKNLEKILYSRLVETFITITLIPGARQDSTRPSSPSSGREHSQSRPSTPSRLSKEQTAMTASKSPSWSKVPSRRGTVGSSTTPSNSVTPGRQTPSTSSSSLRSSAASHGKPPTPSTANGRAVKSPSRTSPSKTRQPIPPSLTSSSITSRSQSPSEPASPKPLAGPSKAVGDTLPVPDYISPVHRPSTNPMFQLSQYEFAPGTDSSTSKMRVEVWAHVHDGDARSTASRLHAATDTKGKGKERQSAEEETRSEWKVLESWEVDLNRLMPLTEDLAAHPSHLPSNTLLVTLSTGETLYTPPSSLRSTSPSRPPSPNAGYNSDPETDVHRVREVGDVPPRLEGGLESTLTNPVLSDADGRQSRRKRTVKSATFQDILKLINLQACIVDTEQSLGEVVREVDKMVVHNEVGILLREISEREAWVSELKEQRSKVEQNSQELRSRIEARREDIRRRREVLALARQAHDEDLVAASQFQETISQERARLSSLRSMLPIIRSNLISIVSFIYPIELVSPPDLLFTILDVPLPIPLGATDPAPPLSLPGHKEVTEDGVATALGYAAQVVQLLAAYLGHRLVYPVTCVGSRSMIKDGISAMVGPRNFPLFSKGVDTYRFEYAVFLLNKDIEMLMTERNLRALDMRHTLPNLKNLLLTLTDNEQRIIPGHRVASSSVSISSLQSQSPVPDKSPLPTSQATSGTDGHVVQSDSAVPDGPSSVPPPTSMPSSEHGADVGNAAAGTGASTGSTPPASGSTTPTRSAQQRRSRAFLDLAPLTGFLSLRGRYQLSQKPSVKPVAETPDSEVQAGLEQSGAAAGALGSELPLDGSGEPGEEAEPGEDDDDRKTIRAGGTISGEEEEDVVEGKVVTAANGDALHVSHGAVGREKVTDENVARSPPMVVSS